MVDQREPRNQEMMHSTFYQEIMAAKDEHESVMPIKDNEVINVKSLKKVSELEPSSKIDSTPEIRPNVIPSF